MSVYSCACASVDCQIRGCRRLREFGIGVVDAPVFTGDPPGRPSWPQAVPVVPIVPLPHFTPPPSTPPASAVGWICPVCRAGVAPTVTTCPCATQGTVIP